MVIDVFASEASYWRHLAPVVAELLARGHEARVWSRASSQPWGAPVLFRHEPACVAVCASASDARYLAPQRVTYVEHGAGQTYVGATHGYAGGADLGNVVLFLAPGDRVARAWRRSYPQVPVETVGSPALDQHLDGSRTRDVAESYDRNTIRRVVVTEHWPCFVAHETRPGMRHFDRGIRELARLEAIQLIGHAHPKGRMTWDRWSALGITELERDPDVVLRSADLLIADNTSLMYEAAALDVPVLACNAPWYRRDVEHGLRFWSHVPGIQVDTVGTFIPAVVAALDDPPEAHDLRARASAHVYAHLDAGAAARAVDAIERWT